MCRIHPDVLCPHGEVDAYCPTCTPEGPEAYFAELLEAYLEVA